uniref:Fucolectin tachylectin-4 pentraxin-1 domain-containing protein n=1 Tax=Nothobranchius furzeri TaxID=105023 RepID=A0A8C6KUZ1_NOTFU
GAVSVVFPLFPPNYLKAEKNKNEIVIAFFLLGRAAQSAGPASVATGPEMAIDSYKDPQHSGTTCASVPTQDDPWWRVDLMSIYHITAVSVFSEQHCCQEQLDGAEIRIGLRNDTNNHRCAIISAAEGHTEYGYQCGVVLGRFVYVVLPGQQRNLTVCEVQVYGTVTTSENVALRGVAYQSSSQWKTAGKASNAIDGVQFSTCCVTQNKPNQWVNVDLVVPYNISVIHCTSSSSQSLMTLDCGGIVGRTVTVFHPDVPLTLCEVEIFSTWNHPGNIFQQRPPTSGKQLM